MSSLAMAVMYLDMTWHTAHSFFSAGRNGKLLPLYQYFVLKSYLKAVYAAKYVNMDVTGGGHFHGCM